MKLSSAALLAALLLPLAACDSAGDATLADADLDAVATVASALALETGGALDDAALALGGDAYAHVRGPGHVGHGHEGAASGGACDAASTYDEMTGVLTQTVTCERSRGPFSHTSTRSLAARFLNADGAPVRGPDGATSVTFDVLEGVSASTSPRRTREVTETTGSASIVGLDADAVTVNSSGSRSGTYRVTRPDGAQREAAYTVTLALTDVVGPAPRGLGGAAFQARWRRATSGTASGTYSAEVTTTSADGTVRTRTIERAFEITFPAGGGGRIRMNGREQSMDLGSGAVS